MFATEADRPGIFILFRRSSWLIESNSVLTFSLYLSPIYFTPSSEGLLLTPDPYSSLFIRYSTTDPWSDHICIILLCFIFFLLHSTANRGGVGTAGAGENMSLPFDYLLCGSSNLQSLSLPHYLFIIGPTPTTQYGIWTLGEHTQREQWLFFWLP